jgi:hypothetical protein
MVSRIEIFVTRDLKNGKTYIKKHTGFTDRQHIYATQYYITSTETIYCIWNLSFYSVVSKQSSS